MGSPRESRYIEPGRYTRLIVFYDKIGASAVKKELDTYCSEIKSHYYNAVEVQPKIVSSLRAWPFSLRLDPPSQSTNVQLTL